MARLVRSATAKGQMQDMKFAEKGRLISTAIGIIEGLRSSWISKRAGRYPKT